MLDGSNYSHIPCAAATRDRGKNMSLVVIRGIRIALGSDIPNKDQTDPSAVVAKLYVSVPTKDARHIESHTCDVERGFKSGILQLEQSGCGARIRSDTGFEPHRSASMTPRWWV